MKTFTFKNNLLKFMLLIITAFTTGNLFAQSVTFDAPTAATTTIYAGGNVAFTGNRSGTFAGSGNYTWTWSASPAAGVSFSGSNPNVTSSDPVSTTATFANAGTYTITITVTRSTSTAQATKTVVVLAGPPPPYPGAPKVFVCADAGTVLGNACGTDGSSFSAVFTGGTFVAGSAANGTSVGAKWRYPNINNVDANHEINQVNAQITVEFIYQAVLNTFDDPNAQDETGTTTTETQGWFAPIISPDVNLAGTSRRGFVQFKIEFFAEDSTNGVGVVDYTTPKGLLGLTYSHRDIDGGSGAGYNFRETGVLKDPTNAILSLNSPTELTPYSYNDGDFWQGVAGSTCNRNQVSRYAEVAAAFSFDPAAAGKISITFRMGYDYEKLATGANYNQQPERLYASQFKCFSFPQLNQSSLPVKYGFFNAKREGNDVKLAWQTAIESNNLGFQIERRIATGEWKNIGFSDAKSAHGNSSTPINYEFTDANNTEKGVIQYRLKQLDYDMRSAYSDIRAVRGIGLKGGLLIYPNPSTDGKINVVFEDNKSAVDVSLSDMNGRTIKQWRKVTSSALQIDNLIPGMYMLRIVNNQSGEQTVEKIMVNNR